MLLVGAYIMCSKICFFSASLFLAALTSARLLFKLLAAAASCTLFACRDATADDTAPKLFNGANAD
jgi:hypothetical protein